VLPASVPAAQWRWAADAASLRCSGFKLSAAHVDEERWRFDEEHQRGRFDRDGPGCQ
jgi:hypothetical protein